MKWQFFFRSAPFLLLILAAASTVSCKKDKWVPGAPFPAEKIKIGVIHITDPFEESSGYAFAHQKGIFEMKKTFGLADSQILYKINVYDSDPLESESAMRELIAQGVNIIFATSWGYMDTCEKLADEFPSVIFAHATGNKHNSVNFTNFFGKVHQARYLSGIVAGMKTESDKIGFVAAWGRENSEVTGGLNAFALGVKKANPNAEIFVKVTNSWFDPMGESSAAKALIAGGCDVIAQHCDTSTPQTEAEKAGVWGIGYNTDMESDAPLAVLTSVLWDWNAYYSYMIKSVIDGKFSTEPWFGSLSEGIVDITPLNKKIVWEMETIFLLEDERRRIESGEFDVFFGLMESSDGTQKGKAGKSLSDFEIRNSMDWYYSNITEL